MPIEAIQPDIGDIHPIPFQQMPRIKAGRLGSLHQAVQMQRFTHQAINTLNQDLNETKDKFLRTRLASGIAQLVKAWELLEDRKRILQGKPLPGSLRPERKVKVKRNTSRAHEVSEAPEPVPDAVPEVQDRSTEALSPKESTLSPEAGPPPPGGEGK